MNTPSDNAPQDEATQQELLRQWEDRIVDADGDPMAALAELLGARQAARNQLFAMAGEVVLGCRLGAILGAGGMGVTYDGIGPDGERVAIKLAPGVAEAARPRFEQECRLLRELDHPAIVRYRAHNVLPDGTGVLVMDLVRGCDLERLLTALATKDPHAAGLPAVDALLQDVPERGAALRSSARYRRRMLRMFADLASGLHVAHERGVVHRDVKPGNVLVRDDLCPVLIDFGLARDHQNRVSFTQSGIAMGTLAYMAPEQFGDDPGAVDRRADVYAMGLLLYRALAGVDLRREIDDVVKRSKRSFLLDAQRSRELSLDLQAILYRCLDPRPSHRYRTAKDLEEDLRAAAGAGAVKARRPSLAALWARDRRKVAALSAVLVVGLVMFVVANWPVGRQVIIAANCGLLDAKVIVDGEQTCSLGESHWLPLGVHEFELVGEKFCPMRRTVAVTEGVGAQWVSLLTAMPHAGADVPSHAEPGKSLLAWSTGHQWNPIAEGRSRDAFTIDGNAVQSSIPGENTVLAPAVYSLVATDGLGRTEAQRVDLRQSPAVDVQMLPAVMAEHDGSFRATWSNVHSPLPDSISVETDAAWWTGLAAPPPIPVDVLAVPCSLAPATAGEESRVVVRCRFPEPMRTAFVYLRAHSVEANGLVVEAAMDGEPSQPLALDEHGKIERVVTLRSEVGARGLTITARMRSSMAPNLNVAPVKFLQGSAFGGHWADEPPCFAVVADPMPRIGRSIPTREGPDLDKLPRIEVERLPQFDPLGENTFLAGARHGDPSRRRLAWNSWKGNQRTLYEAPIDTLKPSWRLEPTAMHARVDANDGMNFGSGILYLPDVDGDAEMERVVSDPTSYARGSRFAGLIACFGSKADAVLWTWPQFPTAGRHGDDTASLWPWSIGDWNHDGYPDVAASTARTNPDNGAHKAGYIAALDGKTGEELWSRSGQRPHESITLKGAHVGESGCDLAFSSHLNETDYRGATYFPMIEFRWIHSSTASRWQSIGLAPVHSHGAFVPSKRSPRGVAWIQFMAKPEPFALVSIDRLELQEEGVQLVKQAKFSPGLFASYGLPAAISVGDLDGDGEGECLYSLSASLRSAVDARAAGQREPESVCMIVSGGAMEFLAVARLPGRLTGRNYWPEAPVFLPHDAGIGGECYALCSVAPAPIQERMLFRFPLGPR